MKGEHVASLCVCFPEALRSLIIAVKSTAKQLSKGKHRWGRESGDREEREGERGGKLQ